MASSSSSMASSFSWRPPLPDKHSPTKMSSRPRRDRSKEYVELIVICHGETALNAEGKYSGQIDTELNDVGRAQTARVANRLANGRRVVSAIYSSGLRSAYQTAQIIAERLGGLQVVQDPNLRERHLGVLQGLSHIEASENHPAALVAKNGVEVIPGGGESFGQLSDRCAQALTDLYLNHQGQRVVVVSHGSFIRTLHRLVTGNIGDERNVRNASFSAFRLYDLEWSCVLWLDIGHLDSEPRENYY